MPTAEILTIHDPDIASRHSTPSCATQPRAILRRAALTAGASDDFYALMLQVGTQSNNRAPLQAKNRVLRAADQSAYEA